MKTSETRIKILTQNPFAQNILVSWHPAALLPSSSEEERHQRLRELIEDLRLAYQLTAEKNYILSKSP